MTMIGQKRFPQSTRRFNSVDNRNRAVDAKFVVKVVERGRFKVYIYEEERGRHHLPHCHVQWSDGATSVRLPDMKHLAGDELPTTARTLLTDHKQKIIETWNTLNPERPIA